MLNGRRTLACCMPPSSPAGRAWRAARSRSSRPPGRRHDRPPVRLLHGHRPRGHRPVAGDALTGGRRRPDAEPRHRGRGAVDEAPLPRAPRPAHHRRPARSGRPPPGPRPHRRAARRRRHPRHRRGRPHHPGRTGGPAPPVRPGPRCRPFQLDVRRGGPTELDAVGSHLLDLAARHGLATPALARVVDTIGARLDAWRHLRSAHERRDPVNHRSDRGGRARPRPPRLRQPLRVAARVPARRAARELDLAVTVDIRRSSEFFHQPPATYAWTPTCPDWSGRCGWWNGSGRRRTVGQRAAAKGTTFNEQHQLPLQRYAAHGGSFPIRRRGHRGSGDGVRYRCRPRTPAAHWWVEACETSWRAEPSWRLGYSTFERNAWVRSCWVGQPARGSPSSTIMPSSMSMRGGPHRGRSPSRG